MLPQKLGHRPRAGSLPKYGSGLPNGSGSTYSATAVRLIFTVLNPKTAMKNVGISWVTVALS